VIASTIKQAKSLEVYILGCQFMSELDHISKHTDRVPSKGFDIFLGLLRLFKIRDQCSIKSVIAAQHLFYKWRVPFHTLFHSNKMLDMVYGH
jgi:hypothetical protein